MQRCEAISIASVYICIVLHQQFYNLGATILTRHMNYCQVVYVREGLCFLGKFYSYALGRILSSTRFEDLTKVSNLKTTTLSPPQEQGKNSSLY